MNYLKFILSSNSDTDTDAPVEQPPQNLEQEEMPEPPPLKAVMLLNNDVSLPTTVCDVLMQTFGMLRYIAWQIMMTAHTHGSAVVAMLPADLAETRCAEAIQKARNLGDNHLNFSVE